MTFAAAASTRTISRRKDRRIDAVVEEEIHDLTFPSGPSSLETLTAREEDVLLGDRIEDKQGVAPQRYNRQLLREEMEDLLGLLGSPRASRSGARLWVRRWSRADSLEEVGQ